MIQIKNVTKKYNSKTALGPISLTFASKETHAVIGSSGCGKSTLLKLINGIIEPSEGEILIDNQLLSEKNRIYWARRMGYVIQTAGLFPHLTVRDNVLLMARLSKWSNDQCQTRLDELLALVGLDDSFLKRYPQQLSGGQQQRVALMRALVLDPQLLLLDEPLGALDPIIRSDLQAELKEIFSKLNKTVIIVTHDIHEAAYFAKTVTLLEEGKLVQNGSFQEFLDNPENAFVTTFLKAQRITFDQKGVGL